MRASSVNSIPRTGHLLRIGLLCLLPSIGAGQQVADRGFRPVVSHPAFPLGRGPVVAIDEGHTNFHTASGRYAPLASLLRRAGYVVRPHSGRIDRASLAGVRVLVVANALNPVNRENWSLPTPSAFSPAEIAAIAAWVEQGGALFLIADHMPFAGAAADLGKAFGFRFSNGFAVDSAGEMNFVFRRRSGSLGTHPVTEGIDSVAAFTGQAFSGDSLAVPVLTLAPGVVSLEPHEAWRFDSATVRRPVGGWWQGAVRPTGRGRIAVFGEAAMFSAQLAGPDRTPMGMNAPRAAQNVTLLLNLLRWLVGPAPI